METFAQRLTMLRESRELKQKDLAAILNVSTACISQYENGVTMPGYDTLCRISQYFGVSIDFLIENDQSILKFQLSDSFHGETTYLDVVNACRKLPPKSRAALMAVLHALGDTSDA